MPGPASNGGLHPAVFSLGLSVPIFQKGIQNHPCCLPTSPGYREDKVRSDTATALNSLEEKPFQTSRLSPVCVFPLWLQPGAGERERGCLGLASLRLFVRHLPRTQTKSKSAPMSRTSGSHGGHRRGRGSAEGCGCQLTSAECKCSGMWVISCCGSFHTPQVSSLCGLPHLSQPKSLGRSLWHSLEHTMPPVSA